VARVVADQLDESRLQGLVAIGVDAISYRRGQRYLTSVVDHESGAIVCCLPGPNSRMSTPVNRPRSGFLGGFEGELGRELLASERDGDLEAQLLGVLERLEVRA